MKAGRSGRYSPSGHQGTGRVPLPVVPGSAGMGVFPGLRRMLTGAGALRAWRKASVSLPSWRRMRCSNAGGSVFMSAWYFCQRWWIWTGFPNIFLLSACFLFGGINASDLVTKYIFITFV